MTIGLQQQVIQYLRDHGKSTAAEIATHLKEEFKQVFASLVWLGVRGQVRRDDPYKTTARWEIAVDLGANR